MQCQRGILGDVGCGTPGGVHAAPTSPWETYSPRGGGQMQHWWDAVCGVGAVVLSPCETPLHGRHMGRVLCHKGTLWCGDRTGRHGQTLGADPLPDGPWGLVPLWGQTCSPRGCRAGGEGAWDTPRWPPLWSWGSRLRRLVPTVSSRRFFSARWQPARPPLPLLQPFVSWCFGSGVFSVTPIPR